MIGILAVIIGLVIIGVIFKYHKVHSFINFLIAGIVLFLVFSIAYVYFTSGVNLTTFDGFISFIKFYVSWIVAIFSNTGKTVGYVINQNWSAATNLSFLP